LARTADVAIDLTLLTGDFRCERETIATPYSCSRCLAPQAQTVFSDERAVLIEDPDHSEEEERFLILGLSATLRVLVVVHGYLEDNEVVRLISARKAVRKERAQYSARWKT
jgi:uncharacterized DUF497 family protein